MIHSVTVTNHKSESLKMILVDPWASGLAILSIEGLGPPKANINTTELATTDGSFFNSAKVTPRNIVLTIKPMALPMVEVNRLLLYKYFPIKKEIKLEFETDSRMVETIGYVEANEPDIFNKDETVQISVLCPNPYFYAIGGANTVFSGIHPMFEFPFSNESLTGNSIEFGKIMLDSRADLKYTGDADTGIIITIHALGPAENITIWNVYSHEKMVVNTNKIALLTGQNIDLGDDIIISTVRGNRYAKLLRKGVYTNVISALAQNSDWFQISLGDNVFTFEAENGANYLLINFEFKIAYGGI